jgi:hypothetical protein
MTHNLVRGEQVTQRDVLVREHDLNQRQDKALEFIMQYGQLRLNGL